MLLKACLVASGTAACVFCSSAIAVPALAAQGPYTVGVENTRSVPVVVYWDRGEFDVRLGTVPANGTKVLTLPEDVDETAPLRLVLHPEGGVDLQSPDITPREGVLMSVRVPPDDVGYVMPPEKEPVKPRPELNETTLSVQNERGELMTVFVDQGAFDVRIGTVPAHGERTFNLPRTLTQDHDIVRIFAHPEGGLDLEGQRYTLSKDAHLVMRIPKVEP